MYFLQLSDPAHLQFPKATETLMSLNEFHRFSDLPKEIQIQIWECAVNPISGGHVQRFIISQPSVLYPERPLQPRYIRYPGYDRLNQTWRLALPWSSAEGTPNDSVYLLNNGLWRACRDSRSTLNKAFQTARDHQNQNTVNLESGSPSSTDRLQIAKYRLPNGENVRIKMRPDHDIYHVDPRGLYQIDWWQLKGYSFALGKSSFEGINVAVDYDPSMFDCFLQNSVMHFLREDVEASRGSLIDMVDLLYYQGNKTIWFIDHRLRQKTLPSVSPTEELVAPATQTEEARQTFRSTDVILTEVRNEDIEQRWTCEINKAIHQNSASVWDFFDIFCRECDGRLSIYDFENFKVLACQALPGKLYALRYKFSSPVRGRLVKNASR